MAYKTIFTAMTSFERDCPALAFAMACTEAQDAHLQAMCIGLDRAQPIYFEVGANAAFLQATLEEAQAQATTANEALCEYLENSNLRWETVPAVGTAAGIGHTLATRARFADLAVVALPYGDDKRAEESLMLEGLLFQADCPTVVVPEGTNTVRPRNIVIGWNESPEAMRAIRAALPFLIAADHVHIAVIDPPEHGPERSDPGGALAVYLSRHGAHCDIQVLAHGGLKTSERLAQHVTETGSEMLVMGAYGHSRLREAILGGTTREMLEHANVPAFMAR